MDAPEMGTPEFAVGTLSRLVEGGGSQMASEFGGSAKGLSFGMRS